MRQVRSFGHEVVLVALAQAVVAALGLLYVPVLTKTLGAEGYGVWAQVNAVLYVLPAIVGLGLPYTLVRYLPEETEEGRSPVLSTALAAALAGSVLASLALLLLAGPLADALFEGDRLVVMALSALVLVAPLNGCVLASFRSRRRLLAYSLLLAGRAVAGMGFATYGALVLGGVHAVLASIVAAELLFLLLGGGLLARRLGRPRGALVPKLVRFGAPSVPNAFAVWVVTSSDRYVLAAILGAAAVGHYAPATTMAGVLGFVAQPLLMALPARLARSHAAGDRKDVNDVLAFALKALLVAAVPLGLVLAFYAHDLLLLMTTPDIAAEGHAVVPLAVVGAVAYAVAGLLGQVLFLAERTGRAALLWGAAALLNVGLNLALVPRFGILAAAAASAACYLLVAGALARDGRRYLGFQVPWRDVGMVLLAAAVASLPLLLGRGRPLGVALALAVASGLLFLLVVLATKVAGPAEVRYVRRLVGLR